MSKFLERLRAAKRAKEAAATPCTCGSGAHPRRCATHPEAYDRHVADLNRENALADAKDPAPVAPTFPPDPRCPCGDVSAMFLRGVVVMYRREDGVIVRRLGDFCSRECWRAVGR